jgi:hypothetical protein
MKKKNIVFLAVTILAVAVGTIAGQMSACAGTVVKSAHNLLSAPGDTPENPVDVDGDYLSGYMITDKVGFSYSAISSGGRFTTDCSFRVRDLAYSEKNMTIPAYIRTTIDGYVHPVTTIIIPNYLCSYPLLESVTIPSRITNIWGCAFNSPNLKTINFLGDVPSFNDYEGTVIKGASRVFVNVPNEFLNNYLDTDMKTFAGSAELILNAPNGNLSAKYWHNGNYLTGDQNFTLNEGDPFSISCSPSVDMNFAPINEWNSPQAPNQWASVQPDIDIRWYKEASDGSFAPVHNLENTLSFDKLTKEDFGTYYATVTPNNFKAATVVLPKFTLTEKVRPATIQMAADGISSQTEWLPGGEHWVITGMDNLSVKTAGDVYTSDMLKDFYKVLQKSYQVSLNESPCQLGEMKLTSENVPYFEVLDAKNHPIILGVDGGGSLAKHLIVSVDHAPALGDSVKTDPQITLRAVGNIADTKTWNDFQMRSGWRVTSTTLSISESKEN